jgi:hypothetical protein
MSLPSDLQDRVLGYYDYIWSEHHSIDGNLDDFLPELSHNLRAEVSLYLRRSLIVKVPIFKHCTPRVVQKLVVALQLELFMPMDYIVLRGEMGNEMFFIQSGVVEVTNSVATEDGTKDQRVLKELQYGDFFGEISIMMDCKRTANVRAKTYCELCLLQRDDFNVILSHHAEDRKSIEDLILAKYANPDEFRQKIVNALRDDDPPIRIPINMHRRKTRL